MAYVDIPDAEFLANKPVLSTTGIQLRDNDRFLKGKTDALSSVAVTGLKPTLGVDTAHDVSVAIGAARDTTDTSSLILAALQIKQLDVRWASGSNAGGLANAALFTNQVTVSFDNATSKILGTGLFGGAANGDTIIVVGSAANSGVHEVTAATANDATLSVAPTTEAAGPSITVYIIKANHQYDIFIADDGGTGFEIGFDDSLTAANFLALTGVGTLFRCVGYFTTDASANLDELVWILGGAKRRYYDTTGANTWRKTAMLLDTFWRANGGGGGGQAGTSGGSGAGGSGSTYGEKTIPAADLGTTETLTVGAGGGNNADGNLTSVGAHMSCPGGLKGASNNGGASPAAATGADFTIRGQNGRFGSSTDTSFGWGGDSVFGYGGQRRLNSSGGEAATGFGGGGQGGLNATNGGAGTQGVIILEEVFA